MRGSLSLTRYVSKLTTAFPGPRREAGAYTVEEVEAAADEDEDGEGLEEAEGLKGVEKRAEAVPEEAAEDGGVEEGAGEDEETKKRA